jgi:uncharacterized phage protein gp47/JayE
MAIQYGLTPEGFVNKPLNVIREDINVDLRAAFGNSIDLSDRSVFGVIVGILAERLGLLWDLLEAITASQDPSKATGTLLDGLAALSGTLRPGAERSTVTLTLTGTDTTVVSAGSRAQTLGTAQVFETLVDATIASANMTIWTSLTAYLLGAYVQTITGDLYRNIQAGTSGLTEPSGTTPDATPDGTCLWTFVARDDAVVDVAAASVEAGVIVGGARDITVIATPIGGWNSVTNFASASLGRLSATDEELRLLRQAELANAGSATLGGLRANLLNVANVTTVTLFVNNTQLTNSDGVPAHGVEALVRGGEDQDIWDALLNSVAAGILTFGNQAGVSIDTEGQPQPVFFSRCTEVPIFTRIGITVDPLSYPADGDTQVANAVVAYGALQKIGRDAVPAAVAAQAFTVAGVLDVTLSALYTDAIDTPVAWAIATPYTASPLPRDVVLSDGGRAYACTTSGTSAGSGTLSGVGTSITDGTAVWRFLGANVVIASRELATFSFSNVVVTSTTGTP